MKKKALSFNYITLVLFCQLLLCFCPINLVSVSAISENQAAAIQQNCDSILYTLKTIQRDDSRTRIYFGSHYETIFSRFIKPLAHRLIENNISDISLIENQSNFATTKTNFSNDFINYQKSLEKLISMDCKNSPADFYDQLTIVRSERSVMVKDITTMASQIREHIQFVRELSQKLGGAND